MFTKSKFFIKDSKNGQFYFKLSATNGETIGFSETYTQKHNAKSGIESVRKMSQDIANFDVWKSEKNGQYYFHLMSRQNNEPILQSEGYVSKQGADNGVSAVMKYAPDAIVVDLTKSKSRAA